MTQWRFDLQRFADSGERTQAATPRRRQKARQQGRIAQSGDLTSAAVLLAATVALRLTGARAAGTLAQWASQTWGQAPVVGFGQTQVMALFGAGLRAAGGVLLPVLGAGVVAGVAIGLAQTQFVLQSAGLVPDLQRVNPLAGARRIFSRRALMELGKAAVRLAGLFAVLWGPMHQLVPELAGGSLSLEAATATTFAVIVSGCLRVGIVLAVVGVADYFYQRYELDTQLKMTRQEVREEVKEQDGDPLLRAQRRRRMRELSRRRMLHDVRRADAVVTNPTHFAVALRYDAAKMDAPMVVAKGQDFLAERIKAVARAAGVVIVENPPLARSLHAGVPVGQAVPERLYRAVAEVLAYVWRVQGRA